MKAKLLFLILAGVVAAAPKPSEGPTVELPTMVVIGHQIPTSWLEVAWECRTLLPYSLVKRAWISKVGWGTPAAKAGIKKGDALLAIGGEEVGAMGGERLRAVLELPRAPGTRLDFTLQTPGREKRTVTIRFERSLVQ